MKGKLQGSGLPTSNSRRMLKNIEKGLGCGYMVGCQMGLGFRV